MRSCLEEEEIFALVDGAASEKDALVWRKHIDGCDRCAKSVRTLERALASIAEEEPLDVRAHADSVMAALDRSAPAKRRNVMIPVAVSALALAAALFVGIGIGRHTDDGFTARGGAEEASTKRDVALDVQVNGRAIVANEELARDAHWSATQRNLGKTGATALVFAIDAKRDVHWIYPAYDDPATNPQSVQLEPTAGRDVSLGPSVMFEEIASGPVAIVSVISETPIHVSEIEKRGHLGVDDIRSAFPGADVRVVNARIRGE